MKYRFNEKRHLHELCVDGEWRALTGCTTILKVIAKPALIQWAANCAVNYIKDNFPSFEELTKNWKALDDVLEQARKAHTRKKEKAGDYGTKTHETIEFLIKEAIRTGEGIITGFNTDTEADKSIKNFVAWAQLNKVKFLESEKGIYSESLFLGGIVDFICEIDGGVWVGDIKTSGSGIYPENFAQIAGYQIMLQEMGLYPEIKGYVVLNLKENGEMNEKRSVSNEENKKLFLAALEIYRQMERIKKQTI